MKSFKFVALILAMVFSFSTVVLAEGYGSRGSDSGSESTQTASYNEERESKWVAQAAPSYAVPINNEGFNAYTAFGGASMQEPIEIQVLTQLADLHLKTSGEVPDWIIEQANDSATQCRFLGVGPKRFKPALGLLCWKGIRK